MYLPLNAAEGKFCAQTDGFDIRAWRDVDFLEQFEEELARQFKCVRATVCIDEAEFKDCLVYSPKNERLYSHYVEVDEHFVPTSAGARASAEEVSEPNAEWVAKWLVRLRRSDVFYHNYRIDLHSKYIPPTVEWENNSTSFISHPNLIRKSSRILLVGRPGSGKTSFARYLAQTYLNESDKKRRRDSVPLVFYCQLRDFSDKAREITNWVNSEEDDAGKSHVIQRASAGRVLFVFDGLDELNRNDRREFEHWLETFIFSRPASSVIVTSRELQSLDTKIWRTFQRAKLRPFNNSEIDEYCYSILPKRDDSRKFVQILDLNPDLREFLTNPFSLSLALGMFLLKGSFPLNIGALCRELVAQLVERWDARRSISRDANISTDSMQATLSKLAYKMQSSQDAQFQSNAVPDVLPYDIGELPPDLVLQEIRDRTGLIQELRPGTWTFSHRYFQDFFCANYLVERASGLRRELNEHGRDSNWVNVWRQVGQLCRDPEFFAQYSSRNSSDAIKSVDRMVSSLLSQDSLSKSELAPIIDGLIEDMISDKSNLPVVSETAYGFDLNCDGLDGQSILILAKIVTDLSYLRSSRSGQKILEKLEDVREGASRFVELARKILSSADGAVPIVRLSKLQVHIDSAPSGSRLP